MTYRNPFEASPASRLLDRLHRYGVEANQSSGVGWLARTAAFAGWMSGHYLMHPVGRRDPVGTLARLWGWQLWRRTVRRPVEVRLPNGARLVCPPWSKMAGAWIAVGLHEPGEMTFVASVLRPGDTFVDVGANIGAYGVLAAAAGARVIAFEPTDAAREALTRNLELNGAEADVRSCALADQPGEMFLRSDLESSNHLSATEGQGFRTVRVAVSTLDQEVADGKVAVLKVDAEGFDAEVLRGGMGLLRRSRPCVVVEVWGGALAVRSILEPLGYRFFRLSGGELVEMPRDFSGNGYLVAIAREEVDALRQRLQGVREDVSPTVEWRTPTHPTARN